MIQGKTAPTTESSRQPAPGSPERQSGVAKAVAEHYEAVRRVTRTGQESEFLAVMQIEHQRLGRSPTVRELRDALAATSLAGLSKDRLLQIQRKLNDRLSSGPEPLKFTMDRAFFTDRDAVRAAYLDCKARLKQAPTFAQLNKALLEAGCPITRTSLRNILSHLRRTRSPQDESFRISRRRIETTTADIIEAYEGARSYLQRCEITRPPAASLVSLFLRRNRVGLQRQALEYRFSSDPELRSMPLSRHFDPSNEIVMRAHKRLRELFERNPTAKELASEYNRLSLVRASADAVWARVQNINKGLPATRRMQFGATFGSGIHDRDMQRAAAAVRARKGRAPTLQELRRELLRSVPCSSISLDALHRRSRRFGLQLTSEHTLTKQVQSVVTSKIRELREAFGRRPCGAEVREALAASGLKLSTAEFNRTLGSAKHYRARSFKEAVRLGLPSHFVGKLRLAIESGRGATGKYPTLTEVAAQLGWTEEGVKRALPMAQQRAVKYRLAPVLLADSPAAGAVGAIESVARQVVGGLKSSGRAAVSLPENAARDLSAATAPWVLPELPRGAEKLSFDEKLARCEQWWVLVACLQAPPLNLPEEVELSARFEEVRLGKRFAVPDLALNPFEGFVQVLRVAAEARRLDQSALSQVMQRVEAAGSVGEAYAVLRAEVQDLARQCGFPRLSGK